jgi:hypothetical protein
MYSLTKKSPNPNLVKYLQKDIIQSVGFNGHMYTYSGGQCGGLISRLKKIYYPDFEVKKRQYRKSKQNKKGASTKAIGIAIDKQIQSYIKIGKRPKNQLAVALVEYLEKKCKHTLQAAQVPVFIMGRITQADLITEDESGNLYMIEVKSGYNQCKPQGFLAKLDNVPNTIKNHWELQRHFTHLGLVKGGLPIKASYVLNVYPEEGKGITVKKRKNPSWVHKIDCL